MSFGRWLSWREAGGAGGNTGVHIAKNGASADFTSLRIDVVDLREVPSSIVRYRAVALGQEVSSWTKCLHTAAETSEDRSHAGHRM
jgi:hypothetical protein